MFCHWGFSFVRRETVFFKKLSVQKSDYVADLWPNLKNLSDGLNLSRGFKCGWFHLKLYQMFQDLSQTGFWRILADLNRGSNSLNSISGLIFPTFKNKKNWYQLQTWFLFFLFWNHNDFNRTVWISFCFKRCPYIATIWCI